MPTLPPFDPTLATASHAASVRSSLGNGLLGLLALTVSPEVHDTLAGEPFVVHINPGPAATFPNIRQDHHELKALFVEYYATDKALQQQIIGAVDKLYLCTLNHRITGFANVTTQQMLVQLYTTYGRLTPADVRNNDAAMKQPYNPNEPIETLFNQIEESITLPMPLALPTLPPKSSLFRTTSSSQRAYSWKHAANGAVA
jgi:hypothetical protein